MEEQFSLFVCKNQFKLAKMILMNKRPSNLSANHGDKFGLKPYLSAR